MLRLIGAATLISGASGLGWYYCQSLKARLRNLESVRTLFVMMQSEVNYSRAALPEACRTISNRVEEPYRNFLLTVSGSMQNGNGEGFCDIWKRNIELLKGDTHLTEADLELVERFAGSIGFSDGEMQIRAIQFLIEEIQACIEKLKGEVENKCRLYMCLGVTGGIFGTIFLW